MAGYVPRFSRPQSKQLAAKMKRKAELAAEYAEVIRVYVFCLHF